MNTRVKRNPQRLVIKDIPMSSKYSKSCINMCVTIYNKIPNVIKMLHNCICGLMKIIFL